MSYSPKFFLILVISFCFPSIGDEKDINASDKARVKIGELPKAPPLTCTLKASPETIKPKDCSTLKFTFGPSGLVTSATLDGKPVNPKASPVQKKICPNTVGTQTISASVTGAGGQTTCTATLEVGAEPPSCTLAAKPNPIPAFCGTPSFTLSMRTKGSVDSAVVDGEAVSTDGGSVTRQLGSSEAERSYAGQVSGPGGNSSCNVTVKAVCDRSGQCWCNTGAPCSGGHGYGNCYTQSNNPPTCSLLYCYKGDCEERGCSWGCFAPETLIRMADGSYQKAERITKGDLLWNPILSSPARVQKVIAGSEKFPLRVIGFGDRAVHVSSKHPMLTLEGLKSAEAITRDDFILGLDGKFHPVTILNISPLIGDQVVYNFLLDSPSRRHEDHMMEAEGIVTGDYYLQGLLETESRVIP